MQQLVLRVADTIFPTPSNIPQVSASSNIVVVIMSFVFGLAGAIAVLVITIAGLQYVISQGEPQKIAKAKDTIIYAIIGLIIAMAGFSIVGFVAERLGT